MSERKKKKLEMLENNYNELQREKDLLFKRKDELYQDYYDNGRDIQYDLSLCDERINKIHSLLNSLDRQICRLQKRINRGQ